MDHPRKKRLLWGSIFNSDPKVTKWKQKNNTYGIVDGGGMSSPSPSISPSYPSSLVACPDWKISSSFQLPSSLASLCGKLLSTPDSDLSPFVPWASVFVVSFCALLALLSSSYVLTQIHQCYSLTVTYLELRDWCRC